MRDWLIRAGLGPASAKMRLLLSLGLDPEVVAAHVLEYLAVQQGLVATARPYALGLLIRRLQDGDAAPPRRCAVCLGLPNRLGLCRCEVADRVRR